MGADGEWPTWSLSQCAQHVRRVHAWRLLSVCESVSRSMSSMALVSTLRQISCPMRGVIGHTAHRTVGAHTEVGGGTRYFSSDVRFWQGVPRSPWLETPLLSSGIGAGWQGLKLIRANSTSSQPAVATLHGYWSSGSLPEDLYLSLRVNASGGWTTTY